MPTEKSIPLVPCPSCKKSAVYSPENPFRPFCSKRCKIGDLASWASEAFKIPGEKVKSDEEPEEDHVEQN